MVAMVATGRNYLPLIMRNSVIKEIEKGQNNKELPLSWGSSNF